MAGKGEQRAQVPFRPIVANCKSILQMTGLGDATSFVSVFVLDSDVQRPTYGSWKVAAYTGRGGTVYVSTERIYVASSTYEYPRPEPVPFQVDTACDAAGCSETPARTACKDGEIEQKGACTPQQDPPKPRLGVWSAILRFEMNKGEPAFGGLAEVEGSIINQFAMDEHDGHLRVATTRGEMWAVPSTSESAITILNNELAVVGLLSGLAPGERIYSVRFMQERGYVVTYRQVDPFFVFDLAKPSAPRVLGELKIPGFSDYLHPLSATHMLGVGKETYEIKNDGGSGTRVVMGGVKLSLFNVKNPSLPTEDSKLLIGDAGTSTEVSYQHKAFLYHAASGYIALPVDLHQQAGCKDISQGDACMTPDFLNMWGPSTFQGAYVVKIDNVPDQTGISKKELRVHMRISHERPKTGTGIEGQSGKMAWGLSWNWRQSLRRIYRSIYMDGLLYTLSDRNMQAHHLETKALKASLNLTQPTCYAPEAYRDQGGMFSIGIVGRPMAMP